MGTNHKAAAVRAQHQRTTGWILSNHLHKGSGQHGQRFQKETVEIDTEYDTVGM